MFFIGWERDGAWVGCRRMSKPGAGPPPTPLPTPRRDVSEAEDAARGADQTVISEAEKVALAAEASRGEDA